VAIRVPGFEGVHEELAERQILCDFRPDVGLRLGPHFFNSEDELEHAIATIGEILASGARERRLGAAARF
jgi:kynureninase